MLDGVEQFSSHAYFTLQVNYHTDRLITESDRGGGSGSSSQLYSLIFKPHLCVHVFVKENETSNGKRRNCLIYNNKWLKTPIDMSISRSQWVYINAWLTAEFVSLFVFACVCWTPGA